MAESASLDAGSGAGNSAKGRLEGAVLNSGLLPNDDAFGLDSFCAGWLRFLALQ